MKDRTRLPAAQRPPLPDFTPVPRKSPRHDGWTPERQRAFIAALADTGCVNTACRMVNMSQVGAYYLRRQPGAESFRSAWEAAQSFGLQVVKDEAFDRAMNGQLVPVFVAGRLMGFRRKKNDRLLMFILRHYGQDAQGRKTTINYFSTRASAGAQSSPGRGGGPAPDSSGDGGGRSETRSALSAAEASTTTVKTVISQPPVPSPLSRDTETANILNAFEGVELDAEAQAEIYRSLTACAERRRAVEDDPENDPECEFVRVGDKDIRYLGELESGAEDDWVEYRPETAPGEGTEHRWENLGQGGQAAEIDKVLEEMTERKAARTPEQEAEENAAIDAQLRADIERQAGHLPKPERDPDGLPPSGSGNPRFDFSEPTFSPENPVPSPRTSKTRKRYRKRVPKPLFTPPDEGDYEARKAKAIEQVEAERSEAAAAEAKRRKRRKPASTS